MDGLDLLIADHNRVRGLFVRFREAQDSNDTPAMSELADKIFEELEVHTDIEEQIFYPAVHDLGYADNPFGPFLAAVPRPLVFQGAVCAPGSHFTCTAAVVTA